MLPNNCIINRGSAIPVYTFSNMFLMRLNKSYFFNLFYSEYMINSITQFYLSWNPGIFQRFECQLSEDINRQSLDLRSQMSSVFPHSGFPSMNVKLGSEFLQCYLYNKCSLRLFFTVRWAGFPIYLGCRIIIIVIVCRF